MNKSYALGYAVYLMFVLCFTSPALVARTFDAKPLKLRQAFTYHTYFQNPGTPDQLLLDEPDRPNGTAPVKIAVHENRLFFEWQRPLGDETASARNTRQLIAPRSRTLNVNINAVPFDLLRSGSPSYGAACVVDFNDEGALTLTVPSLWFDRIYLPWFQQCGGGGYVDLRPLIVSHFHLGYENADVVPCPTHPQAYPSFLQDDGTCDLVDVPSEPRTHLTTHTPNEYLWIRVYGSNNQWANFSLDQLRVVGSNPVRLCYRKDQELDLGWLTSGQQSGTVSGIWLCWSNLSPGAWDLSNWVWDVTDVKVTGADGATGPFSLDDLNIGI